MLGASAECFFGIKICHAPTFSLGVKARQARLERAKRNLKLSDSFGEVTLDFAKPHFQAWLTTVRHQRGRMKLAAQWIFGLSSGTIEQVFRAWRDIKYVEFEKINQELRQKEKEKSCSA